MAKKNKRNPLAETQQYIEFLEKRLASANYKARVPPEEYNESQEKLKKARLRLRLLTPKK